MKIDDLEAVMNQYWRQTQYLDKKNGDDENDSDNELEVALFAGKCYNCGKQGGHVSIMIVGLKKKTKGNDQATGNSINLKSKVRQQWNMDPE
jgi:hypothetical protein